METPRSRSSASFSPRPPLASRFTRRNPSRRRPHRRLRRAPVGWPAWITALRQRPGAGRLRERPALAVPYVAAFVGLNAYLWRRTGNDRVPVVVYSAVLLTMSLTALDSGSSKAAAGGALFLVSDSLLALEKFGGVHLPGHEGLVLATYASAQALLADHDQVLAEHNSR